MRPLIMILGLMYLVPLQSQENYVDPWTVIVNTNPIAFYGYEWRHFKYVHPKKIGKSEYGIEVKRGMYMAALSAKENYGDLEMSKRMHSGIIFDPNVCLQFIDSLNPAFLVGYEISQIDQETIQSNIDQYVLKDEDGIGYVVFVNYYNHKENTMRASHVFFDIEKREILTITDVNSYPIGGGKMQIRMAAGLDENMAYFLRVDYKAKLEEFHR